MVWELYLNKSVTWKTKAAIEITKVFLTQNGMFLSLGPSVDSNSFKYLQSARDCAKHVISILFFILKTQVFCPHFRDKSRKLREA